MTIRRFATRSWTLSRSQPAGDRRRRRARRVARGRDAVLLRPRADARRADPPARRRDAHAVSHRHRRVRAGDATGSAGSLLQLGGAGRRRRRIARRRIARCSSCRSASTCRSRSCCSSSGRSSKRSATSRLAPSPWCSTPTGAPVQRRDLLRVGVSLDRARVRRARQPAARRRSPTTPGSAGRRRPISTSSRARFGRSRQGRYVVRAANTGHQRRGGSVRPRARADRPVRAGGRDRRRPAADRAARSTAGWATSSCGCRSRPRRWSC